MPLVQKSIDKEFTTLKGVGQATGNDLHNALRDEAVGWKAGSGTPLGKEMAEASAKLKAAGIKGIRYKDAGSRGADGGTYNYVIFDQDIIQILKRYAVPFTLGAGGAAVVSGQQLPPEIERQISG